MHSPPVTTWQVAFRVLCFVCLRDMFKCRVVAAAGGCWSRTLSSRCSSSFLNPLQLWLKSHFLLSTAAAFWGGGSARVMNLGTRKHNKCWQCCCEMELLTNFQNYPIGETHLKSWGPPAAATQPVCAAGTADYSEQLYAGDLQLYWPPTATQTIRSLNNLFNDAVLDVSEDWHM